MASWQLQMNLSHRFPCVEGGTVFDHLLQSFLATGLDPSVSFVRLNTPCHLVPIWWKPARSRLYKGLGVAMRNHFKPAPPPDVGFSLNIYLGTMVKRQADTTMHLAPSAIKNPYRICRIARRTNLGSSVMLCTLCLCTFY